MTRAVKISYEENENVYKLFSTYMSYMAILEYFMNKSTLQNNEVFDRKWKEAIEINKELTEAKKAVEKKYKPADVNWDRFEFDFENCQVVFIKNE